MQQYPYWQKQEPTKPLFPNIEWNKPEQKSHAGKLAIIGGSSTGFAATAESHQTALSSGVGQVKVMLPDVLKKVIPPSMTDVLLVASNPSGGFSKEAKNDFMAVDEWADVLLFIGDTGKNSETTVLYESLIQKTKNHVVITRDAFDLMINSTSLIAEREDTTLVLSFSQVQKLFQTLYYPKVLTLSMHLTLFIESLHKFTITYPITLVTFHNDQIIVASDGKISTTPWSDTMALWSGRVATKATAYILWNKTKPFEAATTSLLS